MPMQHERTDEGNNLYPSTHLFSARADSSSEAAALPNGEKALTPIIAGTICGICIATAWIIALIVVIVKRTKRKRRKRAGVDVDDEPINQNYLGEDGQPTRDMIIVPPDPAVLEGHHPPGQRLIVERKKRWWRRSESEDAKCSKGKEKQESGFSTEAKSSEPPTEFLSESESTSDSGQANDASRKPALNRLSTIMSVNSPGKVTNDNRTLSEELVTYSRDKDFDSKDFADYSLQNSAVSFDEEKDERPSPGRRN